MIKPLLLAATAAVLALATGPAVAQQDLSRPDSSFQAKDNPGNWQSTIARTDRGHLIAVPVSDGRRGATFLAEIDRLLQEPAIP